MNDQLRCAVLYAKSTRRIDAIRRYSELLVEDMSHHPRCEARFATLDTAADLESWADVFILQYNPFSYGRRGFAPSAAARWASLKKRRVLMVHEAYLPAREWRSALMSAWQRLQLAALLASSQDVLIAIEAWRNRLPLRRQEAHQLPIPSMLPDRRADRRLARGQLDVSDSTVVLGTLSTGNPAHLGTPVEQAVRALAHHRTDVVLLNLGAGAPALDAPDGIRVVAPGEVTDVDLARYVAACDLFLCPIADGISARRTSVMAALQHEVPVVGTSGPSTDAVFTTWNGRAWCLVDPPVTIQAFSSAVVDLALASDEKRRSIGQRGRQLYDAEFSWQSVVQRLLDHLLATAP